MLLVRELQVRVLDKALRIAAVEAHRPPGWRRPVRGQQAGEHRHSELRMAGTEVGDVLDDRFRFAALQIGVTVGAQAGIALYEGRGLLVLHVTARALPVLKQGHIRTADVDVMSHYGVTNKTLLVADGLERLGMAGVAARSDRLVRRVQRTWRPERIAG